MEKMGLESSQQDIKPKLVLSCAICAGDAFYTGRSNRGLTKLLLKHFISPNEKGLFCPLKKFDFCVSCIKLLENLRGLQTELEIIQDKLKAKKIQIKIKILQTCKPRRCKGVLKTFRRLSTRDFCPSVQISKNNTMYRQTSSCCQTKHTVNGQKENTPTLSFSSGKEAYFSSRSDCFPQSPSAPTTGNAIYYTEDKVRPEIVSLRPEIPQLQFEQETIVKCEPWDDHIGIQQDNFDMETTESYPIDNNYASITEEVPSILHMSIDGTFTIQEYSEQLAAINHNLVPTSHANTITVSEWETNSAGESTDSCMDLPKPPFTYLELVLLAILTTEKMQLKVKYIWDFIEDNFPYYKLATDRTWKDDIKATLIQGIKKSYLYTSHKEDAINFTCGIKNYKMTAAIRERLRASIEISTPYMAYPERIPVFQKALLRESPATPDTLDNLEAAEQEQPYTVANTNVATMNLLHEPPLSISQMCILAIISNTSESRSVDLKDAFSFIVTNFPYYENPRNWKYTLEYFLRLNSFMSVAQCGEGKQSFCTIALSGDYYNSLQLMSEILKSPTMSDHMAFPVQLRSFKDSVRREIRYMEELPLTTNNICYS